MAKAKTTVEIVTEYFQMIRYYEDENGDKLIVILPEGLKEKKSDLMDGDLNMKLVMEDLRYLLQERLITILLNSQNIVLKIITVTIGGLNKNAIEPREIFKEPIKLSADKIILVHNHPSGNPYPSDSDIKMTKRVVEAGNIFGIEILDHIIIGNGIFSSLKKMNKF